jgi:hypothetical protein
MPKFFSFSRFQIDSLPDLVFRHINAPALTVPSIGTDANSAPPFFLGVERQATIYPSPEMPGSRMLFGADSENARQRIVAPSILNTKLPDRYFPKLVS